MARFLKTFSSDIGLDPDEAYLAGLFFNYGYVCYELTHEDMGADTPDFDGNEVFYDECASQLMTQFGFEKVVVEVVEDASKEFLSNKTSVCPSFAEDRKRNPRQHRTNQWYHWTGKVLTACFWTQPV